MTTLFHFYRSSISPYQSDDFSIKEKSVIEKISGVKYCQKIPSDNIILVTNSLTEIEKLGIDFTKIKLHIHPNSGYDNLPFEYVKNANYPIIIGNPIRAQAVSNYILSSLFKHFTAFAPQSTWEPKRAWHHELIWDKKILIIGLGHIGKILFAVLSALSPSVSIYDPFQGYNVLEPEKQDVIILAQSLNPTSLNFINEKFLNRCKKNLLIINAARGKIINLDELIVFLKQNQMAQAFLDVFPQEPADFSRFAGIKNLCTTSHIAGVYDGLDDAILDFVFQVTSDFVQLQAKGDLLKFKELYQKTSLQNKIAGNILI